MCKRSQTLKGRQRPARQFVEAASVYRVLIRGVSLDRDYVRERVEPTWESHVVASEDECPFVNNMDNHGAPIIDGWSPVVWEQGSYIHRQNM